VELYLHFPNRCSWRGAYLKHRDNFTFYLYLTVQLKLKTESNYLGEKRQLLGIIISHNKMFSPSVLLGSYLYSASSESLKFCSTPTTDMKASCSLRLSDENFISNRLKPRRIDIEGRIRIRRSQDGFFAPLLLFFSIFFKTGTSQV
jgi:hypothetical protein